jgi:phosphoribosyl 1,2-cyclic phosphodiesterase
MRFFTQTFMSSRVGPLLAAASGATASGGLVWQHSQHQQQQEKEQDHNDNHHRDGAQKHVIQTPREVNVAIGRSESVSTPLLATSSSASSSSLLQQQQQGRPQLLFLGSGSSTGCPKPLCAIQFPTLLDDDDDDESSASELSSSSLQLRRQMRAACTTSILANQGDPRWNKNYRNNPSILISHSNHQNDSTDTNNGMKHVVIDVGKTFREGALRWMPPNGIHSLDAIVLTHEHFDAIGGLDDVRGFQQHARPGSRSVIPMPIYLSPICYKSIEQQFHYLVPKKQAPPPPPSNNNNVLVTRHVASLDYHTIEPFQPFVAAGLRMIPLPVMHGEDLVCLGFAFTIQGDKKDDSTMNVIYLSDISRMLPETLQYIKESLPPTDVLIVDCLILERTHPVHFSLPQAVALIRDIQPRNGAFLVGMNCDTFLPHEQSNAMLRRDYPDISVQLAHDGLVLPV